MSVLPDRSPDDLFKALASPVRRRLLNLLAVRPSCVEDIAAVLDLAASTVSHHLKLLSRAGLVRAERVQYYVEYALVDAALSQTLAELVIDEGRQLHAARRAEQARAESVLDHFEGGWLERLPVARRRREAVLSVLAADLMPGHEYDPAELQAVAARRCATPDAVVAGWRDGGHIVRTGEVYQARPTLVGVVLPPPPTPGVYWVKNLASEKVLLGSSLDAESALLAHQEQLRQGRHGCAELQRDWDRLGAGRFEFALLETVTPEAGDPETTRRRLARLEGGWVNGMQPLDERCYAIRTARDDVPD